jgi:hypothetical protein
VTYAAETILKIESGYVLRQKGDKKHTFNPPTGTLILTDRRFIFAQASVGVGKRLVAGSLGLVAGSEALRVMSTVKPEQLDAVFKMPESFFVNLADILEVKVGRTLGSSFLLIRWNAPGEMKAQFYKAGMVTGLSLPQDWVDQINAAKERLMIPGGLPTPQMQPSYSVPSQMPPSYVVSVPSAPPAQRSTTDTKFCVYCGAKMLEANVFCGACGKKQE